MAEGLLRRLAGDRFDVYSAGLRPDAIHPLTYRVMEERGIDLSGHRSKGVREFFRLNLNIRYVIMVGKPDEPDCPRIFPGALETLHWPFDNPAEATGAEGERLATFRRVRDQINDRIELCLKELES